ncbi:MAG: efflux RND transporter periplasmic adaptor subunit [Elusimicrobium sp.]|jgi:HlyD family secretion protein|nr:efflux RND transporter periplasmic adaptor subunit [Elusimicrobium sp.]
MKKIVVIIAVILLILVAVSLLFFRHTPFAYSGVVEAVQVDLSPRVTGEIVKLYAQEGSDISAGQVLAELDCKDIKQLAGIAEKEFTRAATMLKTSAGSQAAYDRAKYNYDDAALKQSWCKITSPLNGKVLYRYMREGELAQSGKKIFTVSDLSEVEVWVFVPHDTLASLKTGEKLTGLIPETGQAFDGRISVINDTAEFTPKNVQTRSERTRLVYGIKTKFKNDARLSLKPGMTLEINLQK